MISDWIHQEKKITIICIFQDDDDIIIFNKWIV